MNRSPLRGKMDPQPRPGGPFSLTNHRCLLKYHLLKHILVNDIFVREASVCLLEEKTN